MYWKPIENELEMYELMMHSILMYLSVEVMEGRGASEILRWVEV